jgi:preprotein translocase subunit YajC
VESTLLAMAGRLALFAADAGGGGGGGGAAAPEQPGPSLMLPLLIGLVILFYFMIMRPQGKEQARRKAMLAAVKKNDRVVTAGGIYGLVMNVRQDADEVTIKVDEATNTKIRVTLSAIARVLGDEPSDSSDSSK